MSLHCRQLWHSVIQEIGNCVHKLVHIICHLNQRTLRFETRIISRLYLARYVFWTPLPCGHRPRLSPERSRVQSHPPNSHSSILLFPYLNFVSQNTKKVFPKTPKSTLSQNDREYDGTSGINFYFTPYCTPHCDNCILDKLLSLHNTARHLIQVSWPHSSLKFIKAFQYFTQIESRVIR